MFQNWFQNIEDVANLFPWKGPNLDNPLREINFLSIPLKLSCRQRVLSLLDIPLAYRNTYFWNNFPLEIIPGSRLKSVFIVMLFSFTRFYFFILIIQPLWVLLSSIAILIPVLRPIFDDSAAVWIIRRYLIAIENGFLFFNKCDILIFLCDSSFFKYSVWSNNLFTSFWLLSSDGVGSKYPLLYWRFALWNTVPRQTISIPLFLFPVVAN